MASCLPDILGATVLSKNTLESEDFVDVEEDETAAYGSAQ